MRNDEVKWVSLSVGLFEDDKIKLIKGMPKVGDTLLLCWIRLICMAGKNNNGGYIFLNQRMAYTPQMLSSLWGESIEIVQLAVRTFTDMGMIEVEDDGKIYLNNFLRYQEPLLKIQNEREATRQRVAKWREEQKNLPNKEESTKEETNTTLHNNTIQKTSNSNVTVTVTRKPINQEHGLPYSIVIILRNNGIQKETLEWLGNNLSIINKWLSMREFSSGRDLERVLEALGKIYETGAIIPIEKIEAAIKGWPSTLKGLHKEKQSSAIKWGLEGWIKNRGWELGQSVRQETEAEFNARIKKEGDAF